MVAVNEMHGTGNFSDPRINDAAKYPVATENGLYNVTVSNDLVTSKLPGFKENTNCRLTHLFLRQVVTTQAAADLGEALFTGKANCANCHKAPIFATMCCILLKMGIDDYEASRSPTGKYRITHREVYMQEQKADSPLWSLCNAPWILSMITMVISSWA